MIASLPMYHRPELIDAHNEYWQLIRKYLGEAGIDSPEKLSQDAGELKVWTRPDLVFSQTCSYPYRKLIHKQVTLIGTPDFGVEGCPPGYYRSAFIVRKSDSRENLAEHQNSLFAFNMETSQSGYVAAMAETVKHGFLFQNKICSGGHSNSARLVATKEAEIATIDAVSLKLMEHYEDFYADLKIIDWTTPTPGLPYITAGGADGAVFFDAVKAALDALSDEARKKLMIKDLIKIPKETYLAID